MSIRPVDRNAPAPISPACTCGATAATRRAIACPRSRAGGFSFTEILFAVIVLGIGFIMIAAIFPVAIQQSKLTSEESTAAGVAREALSYLGQVGANSDAIPNAQGGPLFPATGVGGAAAPYLGQVYSFRDPQPGGSATLNNFYAANIATANGTTGAAVDALWDRLNLSLIVPSDSRYAFVGLYRRNGNPTNRATWSPFVQAWFIPVTARSRSAYSPYLTGNDIGGKDNLQARLVKVSIDIDPTSGSNYYTANAPYVLYNWSGPSVTPAPYQPTALTENCYVIIANDQISGPLLTVNGVSGVNVNQGRMNGRIYHVGLRRPDLDVASAKVGSATGSVTAYDLAPSGGFSPDPGYNGTFDASGVPGWDDIYTIGMAFSSGAASYPFSGNSADGNASAPADAYVVGTDTSGADPGSAQEISAFTTFIKVN